MNATIVPIPNPPPIASVPIWFAIGYQCGLAYIVSLCIYQIGTLAMGGGFGIGTIVAFILILGFVYLLFRPYKESKTLNVNVRSVAGAK